jgi:hypothetical protein
MATKGEGTGGYEILAKNFNFPMEICSKFC